MRANHMNRHRGKQLVFMRFEAPTKGIWKIRVYSTQSLTGQFNMWLPAHNLISDETTFLSPNPYTTLTLPGDSPSPITVGAYNHSNNSIYIHSSRGYTIGGLIKPDLAAPGPYHCKYMMAACQQFFCNSLSDKTGSSCYDYTHKSYSFSSQLP